MSASVALSILFECEPAARFEIDHLRTVFGDEVERLLDGEWLVEAEPARFVTCFDCGEAHALGVTLDATGQLGCYCTEGAGWVVAPPETLKRYRIDHRGLLLSLSAALGVGGRAEELVDGTCWRLGAGIIEGVEYLPIVARGMGEPTQLMKVAEALQRFKQWRGLVICAEPPLDRRLFPKGLRPVSLDELIRLRADGGAVADAAALAEALNLSVGHRGEHGSPRNHPALTPLVDERRRSGVNLASASAEARWLLAERAWQRPMRAPPSHASLARFVRRRWQKLDRTN